MVRQGSKFRHGGWKEVWSLIYHSMGAGGYTTSVRSEDHDQCLQKLQIYTINDRIGSTVCSNFGACMNPLSIELLLKVGPPSGEGRTDILDPMTPWSFRGFTLWVLVGPSLTHAASASTASSEVDFVKGNGSGRGLSLRISCMKSLVRGLLTGMGSSRSREPVSVAEASNEMILAGC